MWYNGATDFSDSLDRMKKPLFSVFLIGSCLTFAADLPTREMLGDGNINDLISSLKEQTRTSPKKPEAFDLLSRAYNSLERWDDAILAEQQAVALVPGSSEYHLWLGCSYGNKAEHSSWFTALRYAHRTRNEFERAVELDGKNIEARRDLSEYYILAPGFLGGGKDKAYAQADKLTDMDPTASHWIRARVAEEDNNNDLAEKEFRAAIKASPDPAGEWLSLASFYRHKKRYPEMEEAINKAISLDNKKPSNVLFEGASQLFRAGRNFPLAGSLLRNYIAEKNHAADAPVFQAHFLLGQILEKQGNREGARAEYQASLGLASDYKRAQDALKRLQ